MVTLNLDKIFNPKTVAVVGASDKEGSVGRALMKNFTESGFEGRVFPVNLKKAELFNLKTYLSVEQIPEPIDLAVIAIPAKTVPDVLEQCGKAGIIGAIIISAGFKEVGPGGRELEQQMMEVKKKYNMRIVGPNCLGVIRPITRLNATFINKMPKPGNIAFISQSGALGSAILDWAMHENIGFSNFVSLGSMIDVDFGDLIDYFGTDPKTRSILMYIEVSSGAHEFPGVSYSFDVHEYAFCLWICAKVVDEVAKVYIDHRSN